MEKLEKEEKKKKEEDEEAGWEKDIEEEEENSINVVKLTQEKILQGVVRIKNRFSLYM